MNSDILLGLNSFAGKNAFVDNIAIFFAVYAIYIIGAIFIVWVLLEAKSKKWRPIALSFLNIVLVGLVALLLHKLVPEARPFSVHNIHLLITHSSGESFPSDHTALTAVLSLSILVFASPKWRQLGGWLFATTILVGFSRVFVGVHYPLDITASIVIALVATVIVYYLGKYFSAKPIKRKLPRRSSPKA